MPPVVNHWIHQRAYFGRRFVGSRRSLLIPDRRSLFHSPAAGAGLLCYSLPNVGGLPAPTQRVMKCAPLLPALAVYLVSPSAQPNESPSEYPCCKHSRWQPVGSSKWVAEWCFSLPRFCGAKFIKSLRRRCSYSLRASAQPIRSQRISIRYDQPPFATFQLLPIGSMSLGKVPRATPSSQPARYSLRSIFSFTSRFCSHTSLEGNSRFLEYSSHILRRIKPGIGQTAWNRGQPRCKSSA
jgi:hypothetical protein